MKIKLKDSYDGPIPKGSYEALKADRGYALVVEGQVWCISKDSVEEVDEFEEEFNRLCAIQEDGSIRFPHGGVRLDGNRVFNGISSLVRKEHIPSLILALLKLMDE